MIKDKNKQTVASRLTAMRRTLLYLWYFVSLVIGSGGMAVEEVVAGVAQRLVVTGRADQGRRTAAQITVVPCRRFWTG